MQSRVVIQPASYWVPSQSSTELGDVSFIYSIKLFPKKKKEYTIQKLRGIAGSFDSVDKLKDVISEAQEGLCLDNFGYIEPGHGAKGKQCWLMSDDDLKEMYSVHKGKKEILLWCSHSVQKHTRGVHAHLRVMMMLQNVARHHSMVSSWKNDCCRSNWRRSEKDMLIAYTQMSRSIPGHISYRWKNTFHMTLLQTSHFGRKLSKSKCQWILMLLIMEVRIVKQ